MAANALPSGSLPASGVPRTRPGEAEGTAARRLGEEAEHGSARLRDDGRSRLAADGRVNVPFASLFRDQDIKVSTGASSTKATAGFLRSSKLQPTGEKHHGLSTQITADASRRWLARRSPNESAPAAGAVAAAAAAAAAGVPQPRRSSSPGKLLWALGVVLLAVVSGAALADLERTTSAVMPVLSALGLAPRKPLTPTELQTVVEKLEQKQKSLATKLQVQMDVLAKQVQEMKSEQTALRTDVESKHRELQEQVEQLGSRVADVDKSVAELYSTSSPVMQQHILEIMKHVTEAGQAAGPPVSLDDIRLAAKKVLEAELETHAADGIGREDFALGSMGSKVVRHSRALPRPGFLSPLLPIARSVLGLPHLHSQAQEVLQPHFGTPGHCLPLAGSSGFIEIQFHRPVVISAVSVEHIHKSVAFDMSSAPAAFRVFGARDSLLPENSWFPTSPPSAHRLENLKWQWLGNAEYSIAGPSVQTFPVSLPNPPPDPHAPGFLEAKKPQSKQDAGPGFNFIRFVILSNHGHLNYTCIYRLRVHGTAAVFPSV